MVRLLQAQRFVEHEAACARKTAHLSALLPVGPQLELERLLNEHTVILSSHAWIRKGNAIVGFAVGAILPRDESQGLPRMLIKPTRTLVFRGFFHWRGRFQLSLSAPETAVARWTR